MSTPFLLADKAEAALAALVTAAVTADVQVTTGKNAGDKLEPSAVVCSAEAEEMEEPLGSGNYWVNALVAIKTGAVANEDGTDPSETDADKKADGQSLVSTVFAALQVDDLASQLSAAVSDFTVFPGSVQFGGPQSGRDEKGVWIDTMRIRFYACGSSLA